jgi:hypothetical protein
MSLYNRPPVGVAAFPGSVSLLNDITPSQITANQNDYAPTGIATASVLRLATDASRNITSITTGSDGRVLTIVNIGAFNIVLKDDDGATGTAANRFALQGDLTLVPDETVSLLYDSTSLRWRVYEAVDASATVAGLVELATSAETITGTDAVRAVTPAGLAAVIEAGWTAFTPTLIGSTTPGTQTYTAQVGRYRVVGDIVYFTTETIITAKDVGIVGNVRIGNLPFAAVNTTNHRFPVQLYSTGLTITAGANLLGRVDPGAQVVTVMECTGLAIGQIAVANMADATTVVCSGWYRKA